VRELKRLREENARLKKLVAERDRYAFAGARGTPGGCLRAATQTLRTNTGRRLGTRRPARSIPANRGALRSYGVGAHTIAWLMSIAEAVP